LIDRLAAISRASLFRCTYSHSDYLSAAIGITGQRWIIVAFAQQLRTAVSWPAFISSRRSSHDCGPGATADQTFL
jgi:hypothetical protein